MWTYRARLLKIVDGDTLDVVIDAGFNSFRHERLRLLGVNTPEMKGTTKVEGSLSKEFTRTWLIEAGVRAADRDWPLVIVTRKSDVFGRYLATVYSDDAERCLNDDLVLGGLAVKDVR